MSDRVFQECKTRMHKSIDAFRRELAKLRVGKATPSLLDGVMVDAYGSATPLNQVGTVGAPEPRLLVVQPWDKSLISAIEKAIRSSDLGLNPGSDGQVIRVPIPALTEERRRDLVKVAKTYAEDARVAVRNARREANESLKTEKKSGDLTEDEEKKSHEKIQVMTDDHVKGIDEILSGKEEEILEI